MTATPNADDPTAWWGRLTPEQRDTITAVIAKYVNLTGVAVTMPPSWEAMNEALQWQSLEIDILEGHAAWLSKTKALFERRGWPWTTGELAARSHIREVGE
ncbi:MAG: hypothetical protein QG597_4752 [Actinomycetota bacterium]|nr:hypothetical protein [Actinomycetota bacterium]